MPKAGDVESWRQWSGKPYRSPQIELAQVILTSVGYVRLWPEGIVNLELKSPQIFIDTHACAIADGFKDWQEMREWFEQTHGLPFEGILIKAR